MPWYLFLALRYLFPSGRRFPFFTVISMLGVAIGVAVLLTVQSVMNGLGRGIEAMMVNIQGQIQITSPTPITAPEKIQAELTATPGVVAATPFARGLVLVEYAGRFAGSQLHGVDLPSVARVLALETYVQVGSIDALNEHAVILSAETARILGAGVGSQVQLYSVPLLDARLRGGAGEPTPVTVVGIFEIGKEQLDSPSVYCTLRTAQTLLRYGDGVDGFNVRLAPGIDDRATARKLAAVLPKGLKVATWEETFDSFLWVLRLEKTMMFFLLLIIVVVAMFSVMSALLISVMRKTREIGLLGSLGAKPRTIAACFCAQGLLVGFCGTIAGLGGGFLLLKFRDDFIRAIAAIVQSSDDARRFAAFDHLPADVTAVTVLAIVLSTLLLSTLAGVIPAYRAARLRPVEALRDE